MAKGGGKKPDIWLEKFRAGYSMVEAHPIFSSLLRYVYVRHDDPALLHTKSAALAVSNGYIYVNRKVALEPAEWAYVLAHCLLHFGLWHFEDKSELAAWNTACDMYIARFLKDSKLFSPPPFIHHDLPFTAQDENRLYQAVKESKEPLSGYSTAENNVDMVFMKQRSWYNRKPPEEFYQEIFANSLAKAVQAAVGVAAGYITDISQQNALTAMTPAEKARRWCMNSYPLLGALASSFRIETDPQICQREEISVAAVSEALQTIYVNPGAGLTEEECRFVIAHELLHVGLRHSSRCQGRDHYLWNVACDYVINGWLVEMGAGHLPQLDSLYDPEFTGMSAETIYDIIVKDMRRFRKLATLRGRELSDIIGSEEGPHFYKAPVNLDEFYRRSLGEGLEYHKAQRGLVPAGLEEEIKALFRPPIPWDVELARWFDQFFAPVERRRTYARASRRQSATPDIVRPKTVPDADALEGRTFGVVIDTSGSMDRYMLSVALGSAASYAESRDVPYVRVVFCDAAAYDAGYMPPEAVAGRVTVRGRGGTVLQPGIDLLENSPSFPKDGPVLIITDGECDHFRCQRNHAILIPKGFRLPFKTSGKIFYFE